MKLAYNPKSAPALAEAPKNNDITFDLSGLNIFVKGTRFAGTDTKYTVFQKYSSDGTVGSDGLVPAPKYSNTNVRFLREDGEWSFPTNVPPASYFKLTDQDLNDLLIEGMWYYAESKNTVLNKPSGVTNFELYVGKNGGDQFYQKLIASNGQHWYRYYDNLTWEAWRFEDSQDYKVLQEITDADDYKPVVFGYSKNSTVTDQVYTTALIYAQPSTGSLWANKLFSEGKPVLVEHQSLENYVTLNTAQVITGIKTFASNCLQVSGNSEYITVLKSTNDQDVWELQHSDKLSLYHQDQQVLDIATGNINVYGSVMATGFMKHESSDLYVLLGGGGHRLMSDFLMKNEELTNNLTIITKSLSITQDWTDTGISSNDLPANGTYIVQVSDQNNCYSSGVMSWYIGATNDNKTDEIILHRSGSSYNTVIYLRTIMSDTLKLQIGANSSIEADYTFKFRRVI